MILTRINGIALIALFLCTTLTTCTVKYSLSGASISPDVKTVYVKYFPNRASIVNPNLSQELTDRLIDKIKSQTNLEFVDGYADVNFEGEIRDYRINPAGIQQDGAGLNRFSIVVRAKYNNVKDDKFNYDNSFSHYIEFDSSTNFSGEENSFVDKVLDKIVEDIFNKAFVNW